MKNFLKIFAIPLFVFAMLVLPALSSAAGIVPDCGPQPGVGGEPCGYGFTEFIKLVNNIVNFVLFALAVPIGAIMFAYAGIKMLTAGGEAAGARTKAKEIFLNTLIGLAVAAGSWIIIHTLLSTLGYNGEWFGFEN